MLDVVVHDILWCTQSRSIYLCMIGLIDPEYDASIFVTPSRSDVLCRGLKNMSICPHVLCSQTVSMTVLLGSRRGPTPVRDEGQATSPEMTSLLCIQTLPEEACEPPGYTWHEGLLPVGPMFVCQLVHHDIGRLWQFNVVRRHRA